MNIEQLSLAVRPRNTWSAVDLGLLLARSWRGLYVRPWLISLTTVWLVLNLVFWQVPILATLLFWLLKPAFDRLLLFVFSHATFGTRPTTGQTLNHWRSYFTSPWFSAITWQRLNPMRVIHLAVSELEQTIGAKRGKRVSALSGKLFAPLLNTTLVFFCIELFILVPSLFLFAMAMMPFGLAEHVAEIMGPNQFVQALNLGQLLITFFIEPYFVGACFSLYLNSRTIIEGWDLRITFKKLATRLEKLAPLLLAAVLLCPAAWSAQPEEQAETTQRELDKTRKEINLLINNHEDFNQTEERGRWVSRFDADDTDLPDVPPPDFAALGFLGRMLVNIMLVLCVILLLVLAVGLIRFLSGRRLPGVEAVTPVEVDLREDAKSGILLDPETLPEHILKAAEEAWLQGNHRTALSLLFRGAITRMVERRQVSIEEYATEGEVLAQVKKQAPGPMADDFKVLTQAWITLAYGHRAPDQTRFDSICAAFRRHWQREAS